MRLRNGFVIMGVLAAASLGAARATVSLTTGTEPYGSDTVPVYYLENQWIKAVIMSGPTSADNKASIGQVLALYAKQGVNPTVSQLSRPTSYTAFRDRINAKDPVAGSQTVTGSVNDTNTTGTVTVDETSGVAGITVHKVYQLSDNAKWLHVELNWINNSGTDYNQTGTQNGMQSIIYVVPGGTSGTNTGDVAFGKVLDMNAFPPLERLVAAQTTQWFGKGGTPLNPELAEGWMAMADQADGSDLAVTWDQVAQRQYMTNGVMSSRAGFFSGRATLEVFFEHLNNGETLTYKQDLIVDDSLKSISYAKEGQLLAGIEMDKDKYGTDATGTATFKLNSLDPANAATYDIKNIRVETSDTGEAVSGVTAPDITGVAVAANAHVTAGTAQIPFSSAGFVSGKTYVVKADVYKAGDSTPVTTLISPAFLVENAVVFLYKDGTGNYVLENQVYKITIDATSTTTPGQVLSFALKNADNRNQTLTSSPPFFMFRDYTTPDVGGSSFSTYFPTENPNGDNSATRKSIAFGAVGDSGNLTKTYTLTSMSASLQVDFAFQSQGGDLNGGGFFSEVPMTPGGTPGGSDVFTAHSADGLLVVHPNDVGSNKTYWMGAMPQADGTAALGDLPELDQGWLSVTDQGETDALALSWDLAKQKQYSLTPAGATAPTTMTSLLIGADWRPQMPAVHYTKIPANTTMNATMYLMGDTGFKLVGYAEGNNVMAGVWPNVTDAPSGAPLDAAAGLTNTGTAARTFDLKNIRLLDSTGATVATAPDITAIALDPAVHKTQSLGLSVPAGQAEGVYTVAADLYAGATKLATLQSLTFNVVAAPVADGDLNGDAKVDSADVTIALSIAGGLQTATTEQVGHGNLVPATPGLTIEDAIAIARKANNL